MAKKRRDEEDELKRKKKKKSKDETKSSKSSKSKKSSKSSKEKTTRTKKVKKIPAITEKFTKASLREFISCETGIEKRDVNKVINAFEEVIMGSIGKKGLGEFTWPTMMKVVTKKKPATKARKGINPFTGEECMFKAKPATTVVKVRPLVKLKKAAKGEL